jgi:uncharacterized protein YggT (Ycf19 family)
MGLIDAILNLAILLLWLSWRSHRADPLSRSTPATLAGTIKKTEHRRLRGGKLFGGIFLLLVLRAWLYWEIGSPAGWMPKLDLGVIVLAFRSDTLATNCLYSFLSSLRFLAIFYFWLLAVAAVNNGESDAFTKLVREQLGVVGRWPWSLQLLLPLPVVMLLWAAFYPLLAWLDVLARARSMVSLFEQGLLVSACLWLTLKYLLPGILLLYLVSSYVYLGSNPLWDFISATARNLLAPLRFLPLRVARLDFAPMAGVALIFLLLHWLPNFVAGMMAERNLALWPL